MRYVEEFRDQGLARNLAASIAGEVDPGRSYRLMEFCGGHTHAIFRYGVQDLMPPNLSFVHGPGCPVCDLPLDTVRGIQGGADLRLGNPEGHVDLARMRAGGAGLLAFACFVPNVLPPGRVFRETTGLLDLIDRLIDLPLGQFLALIVGIRKL